MTIDFNRQRYFRFNNLWHLEKEGNDSNLMPFDPNLYPDGYSEFRNSTPEHWMPKWSVRFVKAYPKQVDLQYDLYSDPNEVFVCGIYYQIESSKVYYVKSAGVHCVGLEIYGIDGIYNPEFFTTLQSKFRVNNPQHNLLKNPPPEMPKYGTPEYRTLFKETAGTCVISSPGDPNVEYFDYIGHILVTRKPDERPSWIKPFAPKPRPKPTPQIEYFNLNNSVKKR